ncbi:Mitochondrial import inner membrane translocase subunit TIM14-1 [Galdieria sulphuraria]|uniref:DnaJ homolog subfamily C member 19 n=1 Tax=Galdieria sulphuraria TaxID=130081 RepID=M2Y7K1_GALSU|nr:DnaJ homolog subfamily C member 19 [Galdieria sulphuraria]EME32038.1 DnaJ homolog subfamily C member 19 [Galdieria sulphuraria]GJD09906.1 Mitochondrial import inner membrane translocase subunit TIM14-1 [Galdieria sulphuraria]|eukprot:XP_005708558.1 DnaJ homolog subfamily C member 19 [Galdieria sulphuraria]
MASIFLAGLAVAGAAMAARVVLSAAKRVPLGSASSASGTKASQKWVKGFEPVMTREEALKILGLREGATKEQIAEAHRKLMRVNHPDNGGSTLIASKINEAKDVLLGRRTTYYRGY